MDFFQYKDDRLHCENVDIRHITEKVGTPAYIFDKYLKEACRENVKCFRSLSNDSLFCC